MKTKSNPKILIVDDQPINVKILQRKLEKSGMEVFMAHDGEECLAVVEREMPDLILLDIMMPRMDGLEACRRLSSNPATESIPIIFITAKAAKEDKLTGLRSGGIDYITKPIELDETMARIRTQLRLRQMHQENLELQDRLSEARRVAAIGSITQGMSHSLNNLLGVVVGYLDLLKINQGKPEMVTRSVESIDRAVRRMTDIVRQLGNVAGKEQVILTPQPLEPLVESTLSRFRGEYGREEAHIEVEAQAPEGTVFLCNPEIFESMIGRLLANAWEAYPLNTPAGRREILLRVQWLEAEGAEIPQLRFEVVDRGEGIPPEVGEHLFEPFVTSKKSVGRGLGLTIAKHHARSLGGAISVAANGDGNGVTASVLIPAERPSEEKNYEPIESVST